METEIYATRRVEQRTRMYFTLPFGIDAESLEGTFEMEWSPEYGDHARFDVPTEVLDKVYGCYEGLPRPKEPGRENEVKLYADEECIMYAWLRGDGTL